MRKTVRCIVKVETSGCITYKPIPGTYRDEPEPYDASFGDDRVCVCSLTDKWHPNDHRYYRHFDSYDNHRPVGCKYCDCWEFKEATK